MNDNIEVLAEDLFQSTDILILGNGFDIDLGLKTRYSDFYTSKYWPFNNPSYKMSEYLQKEKERTKNWMDVGATLGDYAYGRLTGLGKGNVHLSSYNENDGKDFSTLVNSLRNYLTEAEKQEIDANSTAASVLMVHLNTIAVPHIFSFNYTDLHNIANKLAIPTTFSYKHIHGNLAENNIIIGIGEKYSFNQLEHLPEKMDFLYKTSSPNYNPTLMADILNKACCVTFFGLTIGGMDAPYFSSLFQNLSSQTGKTITFSHTTNNPNFRYFVIYAM